ncbi:uncharacterized protein LOC105765429 [Gossypium raimondii]|uniref:uncharacterized protein LOC105765429 n=1 Tax=Gossypium raimondii TaxID=29730 RepID=UPI00063AAA16|nr:uncharacterized protein LOC105765429 [Gossypium raimondii]
MSCSDEEKLGYTGSLLDGETRRWWNTVKRGTIADRRTWDYFLKVFRRKFMGEQYMEACKRELLDLVQGSLFVADYETEFVRLIQYAPKMVLTEMYRCETFRFGINREIRVYLVAQNTKLFDELVEKAKVVEETLAEPTRSVVAETGKRASEGAS